KFTFVVLLLLSAGCKYNPASQPVTVTPPPVVRVPQENDVWFKINGQAVDRQKDSLNSRAYATAEPVAMPPNDMLLEFLFTTTQVFQGASHTITYAVELDRLFYTPHVYDLSDSNYQSASFLIDKRSFSGRKGSFEITKIDTAANLISGKFSMIGTSTDKGAITDTLTDGYFNDVPISKNSYGQGRVSALINKYLFRTDAQYNLGWIHPYILRGQNVLHIEILMTLGDNRTMEFQLPAPVKPGTYSLRAAPSDSAVYFHYGEQLSGVNATSDATTRQKLIITRSDTSSRRLWATFDFSGKGYGDSVTITNGVIDSLLWFRE
ncbi:MAG: hypothetical protein ACHQM6_07810, partial [Candidatus Kapaibacterium sp.]